MSKQNDDLEAVRIIADALKDFEKIDQERIIRWARERVGLDQTSVTTISSGLQQPGSVSRTTETATVRTIKEFIDIKNPKWDTHFAAVVAYYYQFEASEGAKKDAISSDDLQEACRLSNRSRFKKPIAVLNNAEKMGLLDRQERGLFKINAVGENLVAMGLPVGSGNAASKKQSKKTEKSRKSK